MFDEKEYLIINPEELVKMNINCCSRKLEANHGSTSTDE